MLFNRIETDLKNLLPKLYFFRSSSQFFNQADEMAFAKYFCKYSGGHSL